MTAIVPVGKTFPMVEAGCIQDIGSTCIIWGIG